MSLNRKTADAALRQVNFGRLGSLVHDNGAPLDIDSLPYLENLRRACENWIQAIDHEIRVLEQTRQSRERVDRRWRQPANLIVALLAGIIWTGPKLTPQQGADILRPNQHQAVEVGTGPIVIVIGDKPGVATWMTFPAPTPARRLDGTLLSQPVTVYGRPQYIPHVRPRR